MNRDLICPFFDTSKDWCEAGTSYVSIYDAKEIVRHCICSFEQCARYVELVNSRVYAGTPVGGFMNIFASVLDGIHKK